MTIKATEEQLNKIFNLTNYQFEIPSYQRPYAWGKDQVLELIDDLCDAFPYPLESNHHDYFFGSIILIKEEGKPNAEVIDGQQRLTTLTLLLSVFRHLLPSNHKTRYRISQLLEGEDITGTKTEYGLQLRSQDNEFFGEYIRNDEMLEKLFPKDAGLKTDSQKLLRENAIILVTELQERCPDNLSIEQWILHLFTNLLNKCYLVVVSTDSFDTAYRIFSTINSRGLDLQLNDILKSEIIGNITEEKEKEKYTQIWENEEKDLGRKDFETLFSHIHRIKLKEKQKVGLLTEYRQKIKPQNNPTQFIDEVLKPCSDMFEMIRDLQFKGENIEDVEEINRLFGWLNRIDNSDWLPPAIYFLVKHFHQTKDIKNFFINLERLAVGLMILRADINERIRKYTEILRSIELGSKEAIIKTKELLSPDDQKKIIEVINGDLYLEKNSTRIYTLLRLDSAISDGQISPSFNAKMISIEHVLPQNPRNSSEWLTDWKPEEKQRWVHRLGNLVLLPRRKNSKAGNMEFEQKKTEYFNPKDVVTFPITINVINQKKWTITEVKNNQNQYLTKLVELWNLNHNNS